MTQNQNSRDFKIYIIFSITMVSVMGVASITPALPKISKYFNLLPNQIALLISFFTLPGIFIAPLAGIIADRFGRKKIIIISLLLFFVGGFSCFLTKKFYLLLFFRLIQGIGAGPLSSLNLTVIGDLYDNNRRAEVMGYNASVLSIFTASFPIIGGFLASIDWNFVFILPLLALISTILTFFYLPEKFTPSQNFSFKNYFKGIITNISQKHLILIYLVTIVTFILLYGAYLSYIPFILSNRFNKKTHEIGMIMSLGSITASIVATQIGKLTKKYGSKKLLKLAYILYPTALLLIPLINTIYLFILPVMIYGTAQALNLPSIQNILTEKVPQNQRALFMSFNGMCLYLGQTLGPLFIGFFYANWDILGAYIVAATTAILTLFVVILNIK